MCIESMILEKFGEEIKRLHQKYNICIFTKVNGDIYIFHNDEERIMTYQFNSECFVDSDSIDDKDRYEYESLEEIVLELKNGS